MISSWGHRFISAILVVAASLACTTTEARQFSRAYCGTYFADSQPTQKTQYYTSKDILRQRALQREFSRAIKEIKPFKNERHFRYYKRLINSAEDYILDLITTLQTQALDRYLKQRKHINKTLQNSRGELSDVQLTAASIISKKHKESLKLITKGVEQNIAFHFDHKNPQKLIKSYQNQVKYQIRQFQFLLINSHNLLHQFIEVTSGKTSFPAESLPSSYLSLSYKYNNFSDRIFRLMESLPILTREQINDDLSSIFAKYKTPGAVSMSSSKILSQEEILADLNNISAFFRKIQNVFAATEVLTNQVRMGSTIEEGAVINTFNIAQIKKRNFLIEVQEKLETLFEKIQSGENTNKTEELEKISEDIIYDLIRYTDPLSGLFTSHLAEVWVLGRLPLHGHHQSLNITGDQIAKLLKKQLLDNSMYRHKEIDIFSSFNMFGETKYFLGEVKFYRDPLLDSNSRDAKKRVRLIKKQIQQMKQLMSALNIKSYDIHIFLINGVGLKTKIDIERLGVTVHGPIFN